MPSTGLWEGLGKYYYHWLKCNTLPADKDSNTNTPTIALGIMPQYKLSFGALQMVGTTDESVRNRAGYAHLTPEQQAEFWWVIQHGKPAYGMVHPSHGKVWNLPAHPVEDVISAPDVYARLLVDNPAIKRFDFLVALDTTSVAWEDDKGAYNWFLSAQYAVMHKDRYAERVLYTEETPCLANRRTFGQYLHAVLSRFGYPLRELQRWSPSVLVLCHRSVATWAMFKDRKAFYDAWFYGKDGKRKKHSSLIEIDGSLFSKHALTYPYPLDLQRHYGKVKLEWRDTALLAADGTSLEQIAALTPFPNVPLCDDKDVGLALKQNIYLLRAGNHSRFEAYAIGGCRSILAYALQYYQQAHGLVGCDTATSTVGATAVRGFRQHLKTRGKDYRKLYGLTQVQTKRNGHSQKAIKETGVREDTERLAADCYMGGMNQSYQLGEVQDPDYVILDIDLDTAYGSIMGTIAEIDWSDYGTTAQRVSKETIQELYRPEHAYQLGFLPVVLAKVNFSFPEHVTYPCLPQPTKNGLVYTRVGREAYATGPEIAMALELGAEITVLHGYHFQTTGDLLLASYVSGLVQERQKHEKKTLQNDLLKLAINTFYGKQGQGLSDKFKYDIDERQHGNDIPPCDITLPHMVAMTTGLSRTVLCVLVLELSRTLGCQVLSATTDGLMVAVPRALVSECTWRGLLAKLEKKEDVDLRAVLPEVVTRCEQWFAVQMFKQGRWNLGIEPEKWCKVEYAGDRALTLKTRLYAMWLDGDRKKRAQSGFSRAQWPFETLLEHHSQPTLVRTTQTRLATMAEIYKGKPRDLLDVPGNTTLNLDPDWKRKFRADGTSKPFHNLSEFEHYRGHADSLQKSGTRALPVAVDLAVKGHTLRGGLQASLERLVYRAIAADREGWRPPGMNDPAIETRLSLKKGSLASLRHRGCLGERVRPSALALEVLQTIAHRLGLPLTATMIEAVVEVESEDGQTIRIGCQTSQDAL
jgi:DNA polymerase type B, organellar and viral